MDIAFSIVVPSVLTLASFLLALFTKEGGVLQRGHRRDNAEDVLKTVLSACSAWSLCARAQWLKGDPREMLAESSGLSREEASSRRHLKNLS